MYVAVLSSKTSDISRHHAQPSPPGIAAPWHCHPSAMLSMAPRGRHALSLIYGSLSTIRGIESPGGDDDRQWLTFWLILTILLFMERGFARVLLSSFPMYYVPESGSEGGP